MGAASDVHPARNDLSGRSSHASVTSGVHVSAAEPSERRPRRDAIWVVAAGAAVVALLAAAWLAALTVGGGELDRADARLASEVRTAAAIFGGRITASEERASALARTPALQRALRRHDVDGVRALVSGDVAVYSDGQRVAGPAPSAPGVTRSVVVLSRGRPIGRVVAFVPLNEQTLQELAARADVGPPDRLTITSGAGARAVPVGRAFDRTTDRRLRAFATQLVGAPRPVVLTATTPRDAITDRTNRRTLWLVLATLVSLATLVVIVRGAGWLLSSQRRPAPRRRDLRQVLGLVGDALASTHNPEKLLPVILHASMEATGAVGGFAVRDGEEVAREGTFEDTGDALRLELASTEVAEEEVALVLFPTLRGFDERTVALAHSLAAQAAVALDNARLHGIVQRQAVTDELTGLANRRSFQETLEAELRRAERFGNPLALIFADIDDFKRVNDRFGHGVGDEVLRAFADVLRHRVRSIDQAARLGGEEFAVLLPETNAAGAESLAESLRVATSTLSIPVGAEFVRVTASFGVSAFPPVRSADDLMTSADLALYSAKRRGKDCVVTAEAA
jgi:diguanylate cyclase (GGDEF)-like protein